VRNIAEERANKKHQNNYERWKDTSREEQQGHVSGVMQGSGYNFKHAKSS
jgi:hypothetical protein